LVESVSCFHTFLLSCFLALRCSEHISFAWENAINHELSSHAVAISKLNSNSSDNLSSPTGDQLSSTSSNVNQYSSTSSNVSYTNNAPKTTKSTKSSTWTSLHINQSSAISTSCAPSPVEFAEQPPPQPQPQQQHLYREKQQRHQHQLKLARAKYQSTDSRVLLITVSAKSFLHSQIRIMVGTLMDVGLGKLTVSQVKGTIVSNNCS
jgi:hypothetical protein